METDSMEDKMAAGGFGRANGPFTLAIFAAISVAILRRVSYWRFHGDLNRK